MVKGLNFSRTQMCGVRNRDFFIFLLIKLYA